MNRILRKLGSSLLLFSFSCLGPAQPAQDKPPLSKANVLPNNPVSKRSFQIETLLNEAKAVSPEFEIDVILRIAISSRLRDVQWKREMLEEAFRLAPDLQNPLRLRAISLSGISADTASRYRTYAFDQRLDVLSVKSRIITEMLAVDKTRAVEMVNTISSKLPIKTLTCSDVMVYDVSEFYQALGKVSRTAFSEKQIDQGERLQFLMPHVEGMRSPAQIAPIADLIVLPQSNELLPLSDAFVVALKKISADDRTFSDALLRGRTLRGLVQLFNTLRQRSLPYKHLLDASRDYLTKHLQTNRCRDTFSDTGKEMPSYLQEVNSLFQDRPLTIDDIRPLKLEPGAKLVSYYETSEAAKLMRDFKSLRSDENDQPITTEQMETAEWQQKVLDFLTELEEWSGTKENSEVDYFRQKCVIYFSLAAIVPKGTLRDKVFQSYVGALSKSELQKKDRIEWLLYANQLFESIRSAEKEDGMKLVEILSYSQNPVLHLYAGLLKENLFSRP